MTLALDATLAVRFAAGMHERIEATSLSNRIVRLLHERELAAPSWQDRYWHSKTIAYSLAEPRAHVVVELLGMARAGIVEVNQWGRWRLSPSAPRPRVELDPMPWSGLSSATLAAMLPSVPLRV
jgi:hypothetical protein